MPPKIPKQTRQVGTPSTQDTSAPNTPRPQPLMPFSWGEILIMHKMNKFMQSHLQTIEDKRVKYELAIAKFEHLYHSLIPEYLNLVTQLKKINATTHSLLVRHPQLRSKYEEQTPMFPNAAASGNFFRPIQTPQLSAPQPDDMSVKPSEKEWIQYVNFEAERLKTLFYEKHRPKLRSLEAEMVTLQKEIIKADLGLLRLESDVAVLPPAQIDNSDVDMQVDSPSAADDPDVDMQVMDAPSAADEAWERSVWRDDDKDAPAPKPRR